MEKVDIVIPWVDGNDIKWQQKKNKYTDSIQQRSKNYDGSMRYRDYGVLRYLFRSIERNASWVNHVFLVTDNQKPDWLDENYEKVTVIDHRDFIDPIYLPTFNTNTIELNIHKIPGLSERFVLLNDDMLFNDKTSIEDFFKQGLPVDNMNFSVIPSQNDFSHILLNDMLVINQYFSKSKVIKKNWAKLFNPKNGRLMVRTILSLPWTGISGFYNQHQGISYTKESFKKLWSLEEKKFHETCSHKVRSTEDVSDWVIRYFRLCTGDFIAGGTRDAAFFTVTVNADVKMSFFAD